MSDTPRTETYVLNPLPQVVSAEWARQLERELNAASKQRDDALMMLGMYRMKSDEQRQCIKRLEEAVDAYRTVYTPDGHVAPHDCFATGPKTGDPIQDLIACPGCWAERKAKEAKP